jgi:hypothetical protein
MMKKPQTVSSQFEAEYVMHLFEEFKNDLPDFFARNGKKAIPYPYFNLWFSHRQQVDKETANEIVKRWIDAGLCRRVGPRGIRLGDNS